MKVGFVSIVGRPNVGKSSLLNSLLEYHLAIVSDTPQTTRDRIKGIYNDEDSQIIFVDTPGIHKPKQKLGNKLNSESYKALEDIELVLFLQPADEKVGPGDRHIIEKISNVENKIAVITKVDKIDDPLILQEKMEVLKEFGFSDILSTTLKTRSSISSLLVEIKKYLKEQNALYYDADEITDKSMRFMAKEIVREATIVRLRDEIPHSIGVSIEEFKDEDIIKVRANIYVERKSQKGMVIGKNGKLISAIKKMAKFKMKKYFHKDVDLVLFVKIDKNWTNNEAKIKLMGY